MMKNNLKTIINKKNLESALKEQFSSFNSRKQGVERETLTKLRKIISSPHIVVVTGLRRVGKSTLLYQISKKYLKDDFYFINFEDERLINFQVQDFDLLHETLIGLFGEKKIFLLDEIQNVPQWEKFVRRLHDQGYKFIITGSNASLLSQELGTRLTGRSVSVELFPFSFKEFLTFKKVIPPTSLKVLTTTQKGKLINLSNEYLALGGIPDALKYPYLDFHKTLYENVLYRDIATRYRLTNIKSLKELSFYLISNISSLISFNKLKNLLKLGSSNTVKNYIDYLENSWLFFTINKYAYSVKEQQIAAKKIYSIDTGLVKSVGFNFSKNKGKLLENLVYIQLRKKYKNIYYYKTKQDHEVDFFIPKDDIFIQVSQNIDNPKTKEREIRSLVEVAQERQTHKLFLITNSDKENIKIGDTIIKVIPLYEYLLH